MTDPDPRGLIRESYRIDGIGGAECRTIFLDWAITLPEGLEPRAAIEALLERHGAAHPDHPMTAVLREGLAPAGPRPGRGRRRGAA